jgi:hypothetical protein
MTYNVHVPKPSIKVTSSIPIVGNRCAPRTRVWVAASNVAGYVTLCKVPHFDAGACPQACVHAAAVGVECGAVRCSDVRDDAAPVVSAPCTTVCVFDATAGFAARTDVWGAARGCVQCNLVVGIQVDAFVDVWGVC